MQHNGVPSSKSNLSYLPDESWSIGWFKKAYILPNDSAGDGVCSPRIWSQHWVNRIPSCNSSVTWQWPHTMQQQHQATTYQTPTAVSHDGGCPQCCNSLAWWTFITWIISSEREVTLFRPGTRNKHALGIRWNSFTSGSGILWKAPSMNFMITRGKHPRYVPVEHKYIYIAWVILRAVFVLLGVGDPHLEASWECLVTGPPKNWDWLQGTKAFCSNNTSLQKGTSQSLQQIQ